jgi:hypothetical protein
VADFDFDHWCWLAEHDPKAYFHARRCAIERFIGAQPASQAQRLRELQDCIDCARLSAGTPMNALRTVSQLMDAHLAVLHEQCVTLHEATEGLDAALARLERFERIS